MAMIVALFDGPDALALIDMPAPAMQSAKPWEVRVSLGADITAAFDPDRKYADEKFAVLQFHATRITVLNADKSTGRTWICACADPSTASIVRPAMANSSEIPGVSPQHVPAFIKRLRGLLKARG